ncbi:ATP-binding protein, partial [[Eubacterium] rectale]|nr:ATP-binding protein [Agathobacter rectalis]
MWNPTQDSRDANKLRIKVDGQYLKVVVEDELGVEVELDQRSEGFQWMVSFYVVFFAEASDKHKNVILLLDEPGQSLHALKQAEFRETLSKLSTK